MTACLETCNNEPSRLPQENLRALDHNQKRRVTGMRWILARGGDR